MLSIVVALATALILPFSPADAAPPGEVQPHSLSADHKTRPLGVGEHLPALGWQLASHERAQSQTAYRVLVASSPAVLARGEADIWDSGKVASSESRQVSYGGPPLESRTRYHWKVMAWDATGHAGRWSAPSWFETGLLEASDWSADWIAHDTDLPLPTSNSQQNSPASLRTGHTLGQSVTTDRPFDKIGGSAPTWGTPDSDFTLTLRRGGPDGEVVAERRIVDHADNSWAELELDSAATPGDYYLEMSDLEGTAGWWSHTDDVYAEGQAYADGEPVAGDRTIRWNPTIEENAELTSQLRTTFGVDKRVRSARLYSTALGIYDMQINGREVSTDRWAPGWTDYNKRTPYQTYDVTSLVRQGANALGARLSTGWYAGKIAIYGPNLYGKLPGLLSQLEITYEDGTTQRVVSDTSWTSTAGPVTHADILDGEEYDARRETPGWTRAGFDDQSWAPVVEKTDVETALVAQADPPVRVTEEMPVQKITEPKPGTYVLDLGQNFVGTVALSLRGAKAGEKVRLRYGEEINADGTLYTENLRSARATDYYTARGDRVETYEPRYTFHGFRYVELTGLPGKPSRRDLVGKVLGTDAPMTGTFETSDPMLNQLQSNIVWSQRGNFLSVPTDCPQRDERMGWTGDINVFAPTAAFNMDVSTFLGDKWLQDLRDAQRPDGAVTDVVPYVPVVGAGNAGWGDAAITVPYTVWQTYGDTNVIEESYDSMAAWVAYLKKNSTGLIRPDAGYGDWLNLDDNTPRDLIGTAYFAHVTRLLSEMAEAIGKDADAATYAALADDVREAFVDKYVGDDGALPGDAQAGYVLALSYGLIPDDLVDDAADRLVANLERHDWHLATGFLGTPDLLPVLTKTGHTDVAYKLINQRTYPSWGYEVDKGATTIWERWNSIMPDGSFGDVGMNSFNHYAYGAVGNWMYQTIGGIQPDPEQPGYRHFTIAPQPGGDLDHADARYESGYGEIRSRWSRKHGRLTLQVTVPVNTTATVKIPASSVDAVTERGRPAKKSEGVSDLRLDRGVVVGELGSGTYQFTVKEHA
ncbi:Bacterial alpha-L-rhamnosidase [Mumia zhuanghuii]|uniref:alpha-L-rhamnosidase n=2 Tax=Mumia TaxID=1546255 RepID=A0ABW1QV82_9ACTN|nr:MULTISPECIES: glycoside hydrolase family 78 protein [Mumia]KAA1418114.1 Bacterial alpha-L-rhamnosidase [Mumia zhuanghuii]